MSSSRQRTSPRPPHESDDARQDEDDVIVDVQSNAENTPTAQKAAQNEAPADKHTSASQGETSSRDTENGAQRSTPQEAFDSGRTTLSLDHISDEELDAFFFEDEVEPESVFNAPTLTGIALIMVGLVYLLAEMGIFSIAALPEIAALVPWLAGIFVVVLGFGLLSRGRSDTKREQAENQRRKASGSRTVHRSSPAREPSFQRTSDGHSNRANVNTSSSSRASSRSSDATERRQAAKERAQSSASPGASTGSSWNPFKGNKRLKRSMSNKRIMGVCSGIARYLGLDVTLVRVAFVVGLLVTGGQFAFAYIALGWAMPKDTDLSDDERMQIIRDS